MGSQMVFKRYELKYLLNRRQLDAILQAIAPYMAIDRYGRGTICNIYYDTPNFRLIRESLEKPVYKEKLRLRSYGPAAAEDTAFVELKKKYKDVVYKRRIALPQARATACLAGEQPLPDSQIGREIAYALDFYQQLEPAVYLSYERQAFYQRDGGDFRLTLDENIRYRRRDLTLDSGPWGKPILPPGQVLMELKTAGGLPLWMVHALSQNRIYKTSFSKYGSAYRDIYLNEGKGVYQYA
ncbi:MAG: polyphosphate polymerase domain-containing protein [Candidatus Limivicinus sp.]